MTAKIATPILNFLTLNTCLTCHTKIHWMLTPIWVPYRQPIKLEETERFIIEKSIDWMFLFRLYSLAQGAVQFMTNLIMDWSLKLEQCHSSGENNQEFHDLKKIYI